MSQPSWTEMFRVFGRIGVLSFGGPAAQIAVMHKELVEDRPWLSEESFLRGLSFCMLLPGPEAMQLATYTGWRMRGTAGGLLAGLLFVLPGAAVIAALVWLYAQYGTLPAVQSAFLGIKAAVVVIILQALRRLAGKALKHPLDWFLAGFGFAALFLLNLPFPLVVLTAGCLGLMRKDGNTAAPSPNPPARNGSTAQTILVWGALWLLPLIALSLGSAAFLADIGWFFSKLAVVTFGGAYAVLAYISQTVVSQFGWISAGQMIDALGLAETTPGPLILVTQFVAMLSGLQAGGSGLFLAAGAVALWATFMPCFLWIFAAAPYVERIASHPRLGMALKAVTATVAGVILNLSVWFLIHVAFAETRTFDAGILHIPAPVWSSMNTPAVVLVLLAPLAALAVRGNMLLLLAVMAAAGLAVSEFPFAIS
ncbi:MULTISPECIES: chromate efflux transporter [unclassified Leisingera]|uniref:chromate efflux transporter n=1 Tax=unclassified Leisingera TaxID=2614906 RepID=UPI00035D0CBA|nr:MULTISPECIES: chromate efflux transporter [unclassified Leisingera]KIC26587.1 chromate transporter [Leisingera sp. ANG-S3]KIC53814.1 chromate transporter [Leisingera sp. ANG-S]KID10303.1 chromate transporter [Leisingera sp. ANG1]